jgi:hypothetical protein
MRYVLVQKKGGGYVTVHSLFIYSRMFRCSQFREGSPYRRLGLLKGNRFGQYFFDNFHELAVKAIKEFEKPNMEQQAAATGRPVVDLERERRYIYSEAKTLSYRPNAPGNNQGRQNNNNGGYNAHNQGRNFQRKKKKKKKKKKGFARTARKKRCLNVGLSFQVAKAITSRETPARPPKGGTTTSRREEARARTKTTTRATVSGTTIKANAKSSRRVKLRRCRATRTRASRTARTAAATNSERRESNTLLSEDFRLISPGRPFATFYFVLEARN